MVSTLQKVYAHLDYYTAQRLFFTRSNVFLVMRRSELF